MVVECCNGIFGVFNCHCIFLDEVDCFEFEHHSVPPVVEVVGLLYPKGILKTGFRLSV